MVAVAPAAETVDWAVQWADSGKKKFPAGAEGIEAYLAYREEELQTLLNTFPEAWKRVRNGNFRERIESAIKNLY